MAGMTADYACTMAYVVSAAELSESKISTLQRVLSKKLDRPVEIALRVDPALIGGLYICVDGFILERTVKNRLADLRDDLKKGGAVCSSKSM